MTPPLFDIAPPLVITIIWNSTEVPILISKTKKSFNAFVIEQISEQCLLWFLETYPNIILLCVFLNRFWHFLLWKKKKKKKKLRGIHFSIQSAETDYFNLLICHLFFFFFFYSPLNHYFDTIIKFLNLIKMAHLKGYYELFWNMGQRLRNKILLIPK